MRRNRPKVERSFFAELLEFLLLMYHGTSRYCVLLVQRVGHLSSSICLHILTRLPLERIGTLEQTSSKNLNSSILRSIEVVSSFPHFHLERSSFSDLVQVLRTRLGILSPSVPLAFEERSIQDFYPPSFAPPTSSTWIAFDFSELSEEPVRRTKCPSGHQVGVGKMVGMHSLKAGSILPTTSIQANFRPLRFGTRSSRPAST